MSPIITLLTDFGLRDAYVGTLKGVILGIAPGVQCVDLTHEIDAQDVIAAAFVLSTAWRYFPEDTVHLVVVDPDVGTARRAVAVCAEGHYFVAPDNGVLSLALKDSHNVQAVSLTERRFWRAGAISRTFHGRDLFAPVAAYLAGGTLLTELGTPLEAPQTLALPEPTKEPDGSWSGQIIYVDRFGNAISNLPATTLTTSTVAGKTAWQIKVGPWQLRGLDQTYADVGRGEPLALIGSHGYLEIAVRNGSAAEVAGISRGSLLRVSPL